MANRAKMSTLILFHSLMTELEYRNVPEIIGPAKQEKLASKVSFSNCIHKRKNKAFGNNFQRIKETIYKLKNIQKEKMFTFSDYTWKAQEI